MPVIAATVALTPGSLLTIQLHTPGCLGRWHGANCAGHVRQRGRGVRVSEDGWMTWADLMRYGAAPLAAAMVGGLIVHLGARRRDLANDRRKQRVEYLLAAYQVLARTAHRDLTPARSEAFEDAISDIVMLGSSSQVGLARQVMQGMKSSSSAALDPLLLDLRIELRKELGLDADELRAVPTFRISTGRPDDPVQMTEASTVEFDRQAAMTRESLEDAGHDVDDVTVASFHDLEELAEMGPGAAVMAAYRRLSDALAERVGERRGTALETAKLGVQNGTIAPQIAQTVEGLTILTDLSRAGGAGMGLTPERAREFLALAAGTIYAIRGRGG